MALLTIEGTYENGAVYLNGTPPAVEKAQVLVTFLGAGAPIDLEPLGIGPRAAAELRQRLEPFAEDWSRPEMDVYDAM